MPANKPIITKITLQDAEFQKGIQGITGNLKGLSSKFNQIGQQAATSFAGLSVVLVGAAKSFADFESSMASVGTLIDTNKESMSQMGKEVLAVARNSPVAIADLTKSLYDIRSAGIDAGNAMKVLDTSARLSVAGLSTASEATNIMTSAMNAFRDEGLTTEQTANILFKTVKYGKTTVAQLSQAFGANAGLVHSAGVSLSDFSAATAALTTVGTPAAQAQNMIRAAIVSLNKPTKELTDLYAQLGVSGGKELIENSLNLGDAFTKIYTAAEASGKGITKVVESSEGAAAITSIATATNDSYTTSLADMQSGTDELSGAFEKKKETLTSLFQTMANQLQAVAIEFGENLAPMVSFAMKALSAFSGVVEKIPKPLQQLGAMALTAAIGITGLTVAVGFMAGSFTAGTTAILTMSKALSGALRTALAFATTQFEALAIAMGVSTGGLTWIIAGVVAAIAALALAWTNDLGGMRTATEQAVGAIGKWFGEMGVVAGRVFKTIGLVWGDVTKALRATTSSVTSWMANTWAAMVQFIGKNTLEIAYATRWAMDAVVALGKMAVEAVAGYFSWLGGEIKTRLAPLIGWTNSLLEKAGMPTIQAMGDFAKTQLGGAATYVANKWAAAGAVIAQAAAAVAVPPPKKKPPVDPDPNKPCPPCTGGGGGGGGAADRVKALQEIADKEKVLHQEALARDTAEAAHGVTTANDEATKKAQLKDAQLALDNKRQDLANNYRKSKEDIELAELKKNLQEKTISREEYLNRTSALFEAQAARELQFTQMQIEQMRLKHEQMILQNGTTVESLALMQQIEEAEYRLMDIELQKNNLIATNQQMVADNQVSLLENMANYAAQFSENFVQSILSGNQSIGDSFKALGVQILNSLVKGLFDVAKNHFIEMMKQGNGTTTSLKSGFETFGKGVAAIFGGLFSVTKAIFGGLLSFVMGVLQRIFASKKKAAVGEATAAVLGGALNSAKQAANAPFPANLFMPLVAYKAHMAAFTPTVGKIAAIPSFAVGASEIPEDMTAQIHKGEMIIPANFAQALRQGDVSLSANNPAQQEQAPTVINNFNFDGASFVGVVDDMLKQIEDALLRKFNIIGSPLQQRFS